MLWKRDIVRLRRWAAPALRRESLCNQVGERYLLRPHCCRNEQFRESQ